MQLGLDGKTAIITGGSGGIGRGLVQGFAAEGCNVVIATRDAVKGQDVADSCADLAGQVRVHKTDVTDRAAVESMVAQTREQFGDIHVLVNNAGGTNLPMPFEDKTQEDCEWEVNLNIWGVFHCIRAVSGEMLARGSGSIINITSNSALLGEAAAQVAHYAGTKGYVMSLSKALAFEWGPRGVRINCIAPGWIVPWSSEHTGEGSFWNKFGYEFFGTPEAMEAAAKQGELFNIQNQPIRRVGRPEDITDLALFLASERAGFITGQLVSVSGGAYMP